ncbi:hypothetical protein FQN57_000036 [Myotisia sp. PD_48]|nr:hypothetical protein FQN57_000036 [Myotisia sp. PD_48]
MATLSAPPTPGLNGGLMVDPTKQAEYPILLGEKLAGNESAKGSRYVGVTYNYKSKAGSSSQKAVITPASSQDRYKLTIQDKAGNAEQTNLTYIYDGSLDPDSQVSESESSSLVLVFDPKRKAFILEPVSTRLNFNLRSAPGKTDRQVAEQYSQLNILGSDDDQSTRYSRQDGTGSEDGELGTPDTNNPFDYRHFLPKQKPNDGKLPYNSSSGTPDPHNLPRKATAPRVIPTSAPATTIAGAKPKPKPKPKTKPLAKPKVQTNPLRQQKRPTKHTNDATTMESVAAAPPPAARSLPVEEPAETVVPSVETPDLVGNLLPPQDFNLQRAAGSPSSNIIVDGNLIIDMGSPPERPKFKIRNHGSNNTSANEAGYGSDDEDGFDDSGPRFPLRRTTEKEDDEVDVSDEDDDDEPMEGAAAQDAEGEDDEADFEDDLVAEMEAALEESAREEEENRARLEREQQQRQQHIQHHHVVSEDESEVSEEE